MPENYQNPTRLTLECVAGKDETRSIVVDERPIRIAHPALQPALAVSELMPGQGYISVRVDNGQLLVDAHNCLLPIYINNQEAMTAHLRDGDVLRIGNSNWRSRPAGTVPTQFSRPDAPPNPRPDAAAGQANANPGNFDQGNAGRGNFGQPNANPANPDQGNAGRGNFNQPNADLGQATRIEPANNGRGNYQSGNAGNYQSGNPGNNYGNAGNNAGPYQAGNAGNNNAGNNNAGNNNAGNNNPGNNQGGYQQGANNQGANRPGAHQQNAQAAHRGAADRFGDFLGLESLKDFKLSEVFSEVFKKHTQEEMEEQLITGTARHTPSLADITVAWAKPWLFARLLTWSALLAVVLYIAFGFFHNIKLVPGLIFVGSFAVPVSTLVFFLEMNIPRNISIFKTMQLLFVGGVASIFVALIFFNKLTFLGSFLGASAAGIIEETAKLLIVIFLMGNNKTGQYNWILNGMLFGAAVGTGFAAFESAGYALEIMIGNNSVEYGAANILLRGITAPFTHIVWTANSAAALWMVKGDRPFSWSMLQSPLFLRVFVSSMVLHMLWNAPFTLIPLPIIGDIKFAILGVLGWFINLRIIQTGLRQLSKARRDAGLSTLSISTIPPGLLQRDPNPRETQHYGRM
jgi:RsiW-degrading membrane proteinase PrsW (M82 family)